MRSRVAGNAHRRIAEVQVTRGDRGDPPLQGLVRDETCERLRETDSDIGGQCIERFAVRFPGGTPVLAGCGDSVGAVVCGLLEPAEAIDVRGRWRQTRNVGADVRAALLPPG